MVEANCDLFARFRSNRLVVDLWIKRVDLPKIRHGLRGNTGAVGTHNVRGADDTSQHESFPRERLHCQRLAFCSAAGLSFRLHRRGRGPGSGAGGGNVRGGFVRNPWSASCTMHWPSGSSQLLGVMPLGGSASDATRSAILITSRNMILSFGEENSC
jgi:hypothetical protein